MTLSTDFCASLYRLADEKNGENVHIEVNGTPILLIQRHEDADYVLRRNAANYNKNMHWFQQTMGLSRFSVDGEAWRQRQKLTQRYFNSFDRQGTFEVACRHAGLTAQAMISRSSDGVATLDDNAFRELTAAVLSENFFEVPFSETGVDLDLLAELMSYGSEYSFVPQGKVSELYRQRMPRLPALRRGVLQMFRKFRNGALATNPMISAMLAADRDPANDIVLEHELTTFFAAATETAAATTGWACYLLARYPEIQEELRRDAMRFWNGDDRDWASLSRLAKIADFASEALRLYPSTPFISRTSIAPDTIGNEAIAAGQLVLISFVGVQHDRRLRNEPWRLDISGAARREPASGNASAFSAGPRVCGGKHFALIELATFIAVFLRDARFELTSEAPPVFHWKAQMLREGGHPVRVTAL